jgi:hypothetical protein
MNNAIKISILLLSDYFDDDTDRHNPIHQVWQEIGETEGRQTHIEKWHNIHPFPSAIFASGDLCLSNVCFRTSLPHVFCFNLNNRHTPRHTCCSLFLSPNSPVLLSSTALQRRELVYMYTPLHPHLVIETNRCGESFEMRRFEYRHQFATLWLIDRCLWKESEEQRDDTLRRNKMERTTHSTHMLLIKSNLNLIQMLFDYKDKEKHTRFTQDTWLISIPSLIQCSSWW